MDVTGMDLSKAKMMKTAEKVADRLFEIVSDVYCDTVGDIDSELVEEFLFNEDSELGDKFERNVYKILAKKLLK